MMISNQKYGYLTVSIGDLVVNKKSGIEYKVIPCPSYRKGFYEIYLEPTDGINIISRIVGESYLSNRYWEISYLKYDPTQQADLDSDI